MLLNLSNHPLSTWPAEQMQEAIRLFGEVQDMPFPFIDPAWSLEEVTNLAMDYCEKIAILANDKEVSVHLMGELTFTYSLLSLLQDRGISAYASTTTRRSVDLGEGRKQVLFQFVQFRRYF